MKEGIRFTRTSSSLCVNVIRNDQTIIDLFSTIEELLRNLIQEDIFIIADRKVLELYKDQMAPLLQKHHILGLDVSEHEKNWENLAKALDEVITSKISRKGAIVAVGGGVVTDMAGLAANLYFRGVRSILIPTTLLAMVDAAVGGKVAVNHPHQKNLLGAFYHPSKVMMAIEFLQTNDERQMYSAAGEILKLSILSHTNLFSRIKNRPENWVGNADYLKEIILLSAAEKLRMLGDNCFERNLRRPLNLGHTIGHPIEDITDFRVLHGEAVAYGLLIACHISFQRGMLAQNDFHRIYKVATSFGCTIQINGLDKEKLWKRINRLIAQRGGKGLLFVLPIKIGKTEIVQNITKLELFTAIDELKIMANHATSLNSSVNILSV